MLKRFFAAASLLAAMLIFMVIHYSFSKREKINDTLAFVVTMSRMASLSLGTAFYEPRVDRMDNMGNPAYPEMMPIDRMGFVYGSSKNSLFSSNTPAVANASALSGLNAPLSHWPKNIIRGTIDDR